MSRLERRTDVDILKVIGILLVLLAHVCNNVIIYKLRNFDVILLIIVSGILSSKKEFRNKKDVFEYYKKRFFRIVIPTWIFLTILFLGNYFANFLNLGIDVDFKDILDSYFFTNGGIKYMWIIRIFVFTSIFLPLLLYLKKKLKPIKYWTIMIVLYVLYEFGLYFNVLNNICVLDLSINYIIPYVFITFSIGLYLDDIKKKNICKISIVFLIIYCILEIFFIGNLNTIELVKAFKYPPKLYYLSYGIGISLLLYYFIRYKSKIKLRQNKLITFVSNNTLEIYFLHIVFLQLTNKIENFIIFRYIIVLICSLVSVYVVNKFFSMLLKRRKRYEINNSNTML